mmetsp:Transcript_25253/g.79673  ORF Transcript_25253/g.79673 Transcript_25253/m.79673 type:complete len:249 (-) Transcript_25253:15-761(-)
MTNGIMLMSMPWGFGNSTRPLSTRPFDFLAVSTKLRYTLAARTVTDTSAPEPCRAWPSVKPASSAAPQLRLICRRPTPMREAMRRRTSSSASEASGGGSSTKGSPLHVRKTLVQGPSRNPAAGCSAPGAAPGPPAPASPAAAWRYCGGMCLATMWKPPSFMGRTLHSSLLARSPSTRRTATSASVQPGERFRQPWTALPTEPAALTKVLSEVIPSDSMPRASGMRAATYMLAAMHPRPEWLKPRTSIT